MIIDSSALLAILFNEPEKESFLEAIQKDPYIKMSVANYLESAIRIDSFRDPILSRLFDELVEEMGIELKEVTPDQAQIARQAFKDFGKGSGHSASLNFGDCFAYALTKATKEKLLFKGNDFPETDINSAIPS
ncbi:MAG: type II toxin-antitoxin system VapC family toxin [Leptospiraceae bacterium]|nr:type II toxin-antitoxin system VapC family toxin [Leptospiraceae bacterium]MBK7054019.1 type II toxin-antitoxin system VapC family toxin [Leptospiraceae bacterium]MBK9499861.1 type II toxin-antitoxin system VapC family toxin [Leptospiraceae bacterium]MBL0262524.1 type II toxin-antitoxin system VapC family toxin [Leptospiraceae bacterium]MBP9163365.1 type II toxin-antitoxin system VapC family toxin [Leptospiraceae bacterium]